MVGGLGLRRNARVYAEGRLGITVMCEVVVEEDWSFSLNMRRCGEKWESL